MERLENKHLKRALCDEFGDFTFKREDYWTEKINRWKKVEEGKMFFGLLPKKKWVEVNLLFDREEHIKLVNVFDGYRGHYVVRLAVDEEKKIVHWKHIRKYKNEMV